MIMQHKTKPSTVAEIVITVNEFKGLAHSPKISIISDWYSEQNCRELSMSANFSVKQLIQFTKRSEWFVRVWFSSQLTKYWPDYWVSDLNFRTGSVLNELSHGGVDNDISFSYSYPMPAEDCYFRLLWYFCSFSQAWASIYCNCMEKRHNNRLIFLPLNTSSSVSRKK